MVPPDLRPRGGYLEEHRSVGITTVACQRLVCRPWGLPSRFSSSGPFGSGFRRSDNEDSLPCCRTLTFKPLDARSMNQRQRGLLFFAVALRLWGLRGVATLVLSPF